MPAEIEVAISELQSRLAERSPDLVSSLVSLATTYRWLYYVERLARIVEAWDEITEDVLNSMLRWIEAFKKLEIAYQQQ